MLARIFKTGKTAMQSGTSRAEHWVLEFDSSESKKIDPLMGWTGSNNTQSQVKLIFENKDEAAAYAEKHGINYTVIESQRRKAIVRKNGYGENFATNRKTTWTH